MEGRERRGGEMGKYGNVERKQSCFMFSPLSSPLSFSSFPLCLSFSLVLLVFIVITTAAPLESSTFFSTGAINEEGLTPFSSSSSPFSSFLQVRLLVSSLVSCHLLFCPPISSPLLSSAVFFLCLLFSPLLTYHVSFPSSIL